MTMHGELVVTGGSDGLVKIWKLASPDESGWCFANVDLVRIETVPLEFIQELQSLDLRNKLPMSLAIATLPGTACMCISYRRDARPENATAFLLAIGGTKNVIDVWTGSTGADVRLIHPYMFFALTPAPVRSCSVPARPRRLGSKSGFQACKHGRAWLSPCFGLDRQHDPSLEHREICSLSAFGDTKRCPSQ
jgi:hypothetical protein